MLLPLVDKRGRASTGGPRPPSRSRWSQNADGTARPWNENSAHFVTAGS